MQDGAVSLRVVRGLLLPPAASATPAAPCGLPAIGSVGPVDGRRALAPAAAHAAPNRGLLIWHTIVAAGDLLGHPGAAPKGPGLPAAGLEADLDLSEPWLAYGGGTQQARAAHGDQRNNKAVELGTPRLSSSPSRGSLSSFLDPSGAQPCSPSLLPFLLTDPVPPPGSGGVPFKANAASAMHTIYLRTRSHTAATAMAGRVAVSLC